MKTTVIIITKNRPFQTKRLISSILRAKTPVLTSLVLIDDSTRSNYEILESFLFSFKDKCKYEHKSSLEIREEVQTVLDKTAFEENQKASIETCIGIKSPFLEFAETLSKLTPFRQSFFSMLSQSFGPYSTARNSGIYWAFRVFNPETVIFLDDDCYIEKPERLNAALQLINKKIGGKEIVAVSGLYEDLSLVLQKRKHPYEEALATFSLTGMNAFLRRSFLTEQQKRLVVLPYHALGGALILSKKAFSVLPFDPFIPRGEDHAYCVDFKTRWRRKFVIVRDNLFIVKHDPQKENQLIDQEKNTIRDIFRFVYLRFKIGHSFIRFFDIRWALSILLKLFLKPSESKQCFVELWALLFLARMFGKKNAGRYFETAKAWEFFIEKTGRLS